jgi:hypothetical protein
MAAGFRARRFHADQARELANKAIREPDRAEAWSIRMEVCTENLNRSVAVMKFAQRACELMTPDRSTGRETGVSYPCLETDAFGRR